MKGFAKAQRAYDAQVPEEAEACPECGAEFNVECECGFAADSEPCIEDFNDAPEPECFIHGMDA